MMKRILTCTLRLSALAFALFPAASFAEIWIGRIQVASQDEIAALVDIGFEVYHDELPGCADLVFDDAGYRRLLSLGYDPQRLTPLNSLTPDRIDPEYHTYLELTAELLALEAQYPTLCRVDSIGRATQFPRTIWAVKLSDDAATEEDEPALFFFGTHHASEVMGCETLLYMIHHFLENYGVDPTITQWMNNYEIWFVPLVNPDGHYAVTENINLFWRKNARDINNNNIYYEFTGGTWWTDDHEGIDLNRNYNWYWSNDGSSNIWNYSYRGAAPFSESENQALRSLAASQRFVAGISFHSYGDVVIAPWTWPGGLYAPDQDVINSIGNALAARFLKDNGTPFSYDIYPGQGGRCPNWFYGFAGAIAYDIELCPYPVFIPPGSQLAERTARYMNGSVYLLERMSGPGITGHVRDAVTNQPLAARVEIQGRISSQVKARFAEPQYGRFTRLLNNGTYTVLAAMPGYQTQRIHNVVVNNTMTLLDISLQPSSTADDFSPEPVSAAKASLKAVQIGTREVRFELELNAPQHISLKMYNLLGREVADLVNGWRESGRHEIDFSLAALPSGVYFAQLKAAGSAEAVKVVVLK
jgi:hypothetical protein